MWIFICIKMENFKMPFLQIYDFHLKNKYLELEFFTISNQYVCNYINYGALWSFLQTKFIHNSAFENYSSDKVLR